MNRLQYVGKGLIVDTVTQNLVSPRAVVARYNALLEIAEFRRKVIEEAGIRQEGVRHG